MPKPNNKRNPAKSPAKTQLRGVTAERPCPVCSGDHKCSVGDDGLIICGRRADEIAGFVLLGPAEGDSQFTLYRHADEKPSLRGENDDNGEAERSDVNWIVQQNLYRKQLTPKLAADLAENLGVPAKILRSFGLGWHKDFNCWTFPERDASRAITGINRRYRDGEKRMIQGGRRGLMFLKDWDDIDDPLLCVEGVTDAAALTAMGLTAVGRPSNVGGVDYLAELLGNVPSNRTIIVVGENDKKPDGSWPGRDGAVGTADQLALRLRRPILIACPPNGAKDVRAWLNGHEPDLDDRQALEALGDTLLAALLADAREAIVWEPLLRLEDPDLPAFPVGALPCWLSDYVAALAEATQTPPDLAGMLVLSVVAVAVAKKAVVQVRDGYIEPLNIFVAVAQPPGSRKSAVFRSVVAPVEQFEIQQAAEGKALAAEQRTQLEIEERTLEKLQVDASKAGAEAREDLIEAAKAQARVNAGMVVPEPLRLVADDVTPEKLASMMAAHGGRLGILSPEGGVFSMMGGRYSAKKDIANLSIYLKGHAGDTLRVDRKGRPSEYIDRPALTLGLAVQPDVIRGLAQVTGFRGQGLLARFLYALPESRVGSRDIDPPTVPSAVSETYAARVRLLLELPYATDANGAPVEHVITLSGGAYDAWLDFSAYLEPQLAEFGGLGHVADWASKLAGAVARIAGLLHLADHAGESTPWALPIPANVMRRAVQIGRYLIPHARAAFGAMGCDPAIDDAKHVMGWITRHAKDEFTRRDCFEGTKSRFGVVENLQSALKLLVEHNYLRERPAPVRPGRGRPSPTYDVNPAALTAKTRAALPSLSNALIRDADPDIAQSAAPPTGHDCEPSPRVDCTEFATLGAELPAAPAEQREAEQTVTTTESSTSVPAAISEERFEEGLI